MSEPGNPKDQTANRKLPLHLWPASATALGSLGMLDGALKYGTHNYRAVPVKASVYVAACMRHLALWYEGQDYDADSGVPHLGHALANLAILADSDMADTLIDDRSYPGGYIETVSTLGILAEYLYEMHSGKNPKHYTIDSPVMQ